MQGPDAWPAADRAHKAFDILAQVSATNRSREDHIKVVVLENLETEISKCDIIKRYVDKFIAHAAAPETRESLSEEEKSLTIERLEKSQKIIFQVASFICGQLLWQSNIGGLPVPQYNHLENLDKKWANQKSKA
jgi:hypothetical protein